MTTKWSIGACRENSTSLRWRRNGRDGVSNHCLTIVYSTVYSDVDQNIEALAFVRVIHWWPVKSPQKWPVTRKMSPFDDVIMITTKRRVIKSSQLQATFFYIMTRRHYQHYIIFVGEIHHQSPVVSSYTGPLMQDFCGFFIVSLNKLLKKQSSYLIEYRYYHAWDTCVLFIMTPSSNGNIFHASGPFEGDPSVTGGFPSHNGQWRGP